MAQNGIGMHQSVPKNGFRRSCGARKETWIPLCSQLLDNNGLRYGGGETSKSAGKQMHENTWDRA